MTTDASLLAWGAHCNGRKVQGSWTSQQAKMHINVLELWAVWKGLKVFLPFLRHKEVLIQTDNTAVLYYINKSGGTRSILLCSNLWDMMLWCQKHGIHLQAVHVPGKDNVLADRLSRQLCSPLEWSLKQEVANQIFQTWEWPRWICLRRRTIPNCPSFVP